jgi:hypothetical protein
MDIGQKQKARRDGRAFIEEDFLAVAFRNSLA